MGSTDTGAISAGASTVDWDALRRTVTYQVYANEILGWVPVSSHVYRQLSNPNTRRILIKETKTISTAQLPTT